MKKLLSLLICGLLLCGCGDKYDDSDIKKRLDNLENTRIPSIESQVAAIQTSLPLLRQTDEEIKGYITTLQGKIGALEQSISDVNVKIKALEYTLQTDFSQRLADVVSQLNAHKQEIQNKIDSFNSSIESLQAADTELEKKISYLEGKIDMQKDWVTATFTTLTQYNGLVADIATIRTNIETMNKNIADLETRINEKIATDIATTVSGLQEEIQQQVTEITDAYTAAIGTAKNEITAAYTSAISSAIDNCIATMKDWVNEKLANYYNIAAIDAKVLLLQNAITDGDKKLDEAIKEKEALLKDAIANSEKALQKAIADGDTALQNQIEQYISSLQEELNNSVQALEAQIQTVKEALEQAIAAGDNALQKKLTEEIERLENKINENYEILNAKISEETTRLQEEINATNTALETAKREITDAYTTAITTAIETNNGLIDKKVADEITTVNNRIDAEIETLNNKISAIETRLDALEQEINNKILALDGRVSDLEDDMSDLKNSIADLLKRIQSVSYIPRYSDGQAIMKKIIDQDKGIVEFDFMISPKDAVSELAKVWNDAVTMKAVYTQTRAVSFVDLPIINFETDAGNGIISLKVSGENLAPDYFLSNISASAVLFISDGNNSIVSDYIPMLVDIYSDYTITYTTNNDKIIDNPHTGDSSIFWEKVIANTYSNGEGKLVFRNNNLLSISQYAFYGCNNLSSITIPEGITSIGEHAFSGCSSLTSISLPESITTIEKYAFSGCDNLANTHINNIESWCKISFKGLGSKPLGSVYINGNLATNITIPNSIVSIAPTTFANWINLTNVIISDGVTSIGNSAFADCDNLITITIPNSVTSIGDQVFSSCGSLTNIYCQSTIPPQLGSDMLLFASSAKIYVPTESIDTYKTTTNWSQYANRIIGCDFE